MDSSFNNYTTGLLDLLSEDTREALLASGTRIRLKHKQIAQFRGHRIIGLSIILKGRLRLMTLGVDGTAHLTAILGPGQQFNEVTLFANTRRTHDAEAVGDTEILHLTAAEYERLARQYPDIVEALLISNVQRLHQVIEVLNDLRSQSKLVAVARILLKNAWGYRGGGNSIDLDVVQEDIAMFLGITRSYLNQSLRQLCNLGFIELSYRRIKMLDPAGLNDWVNSEMTYDPVENYGFLPVVETADLSP